MPDFSFIVLTFNEELQLPKFFESVRPLGADVFVLDSGSTDRTLEICAENGAVVAHQPFVNHPQQWDHALQRFAVTTPWIIGLDADQGLDPLLAARLLDFRDSDYSGISGIYFQRKYIWKGKQIRFGGFQDFYLLKMFRTGVGYSDLNENMDHRFVVPGEVVSWKTGYLFEENFKENRIGFWIDKHNRYSDLVAQEEVERRLKLRVQAIDGRFFGSPDQRRARIKALWWQMPLYVRPWLYFTWRVVFRFGILDGATGMLFHFMHAFWFRMLVDVKIGELLKHPDRQHRNIV